MNTQPGPTLCHHKPCRPTPVILSAGRASARARWQAERLRQFVHHKAVSGNSHDHFKPTTCHPEPQHNHAIPSFDAFNVLRRGTCSAAESRKQHPPATLHVTVARNHAATYTRMQSPAARPQFSHTEASATEAGSVGGLQIAFERRRYGTNTYKSLNSLASVTPSPITRNSIFRRHGSILPFSIDESVFCSISILWQSSTWVIFFCVRNCSTRLPNRTQISFAMHRAYSQKSITSYRTYTSNIPIENHSRKYASIWFQRFAHALCSFYEPRCGN